MKRILLLVGALGTLTAHAQTTLFSDNFESGGANWTLQSPSGLTNGWIINNTYAGYSALGILDTPSQPGTVTGGPNSNYMHIVSGFCANLSICNASFLAGAASNSSATMSNSIVTTGYSSVTLEFIYLSNGFAGTAYGIVEYSTDDGTSWSSASPQYTGISTWTQASISLPAFDDQASLKFRFRWVNADDGVDPPFAVDEIKITGISTPTSSISTGALSDNSFCRGSVINITVPFNVSGTINPGNVYKAYLSDASGSFASPLEIGSLTSSATGAQTIAAAIPASTTAGTGYRIRVDASDPAITGSDNGSDIVIHDLPDVVVTSVPTDGLICNGGTAVLTATGAQTYSWSPTSSLNNPSADVVSATPSTNTTYSVIGTDANGCVNTATFSVTVQDCAGIEETSATTFAIYPNPVTDKLLLDVSQIEQSIVSVELCDLSGKVLRKLASNQQIIDVSELEAGMYFIQLKTQHELIKKSFIKQ